MRAFLSFFGLIVLTLAALYSQASSLPMVAGALRGMGLVSAGMICGTALRLATSVGPGPMGIGPSVALGVATSFAGAYVSYFLDGATGGVIVTLQTLLFLLAFYFAPRHGVLAARRRRLVPVGSAT